MMWLLALSLLLVLATETRCFTRTSITFDAGQTTDDLKKGIAFTINFTLSWDLQPTEALIVTLPRFTRRLKEDNTVWTEHGRAARRRLSEDTEDWDNIDTLYTDSSSSSSTRRKLPSASGVAYDYEIENPKYDIALGELRVSPSTMFRGGWTESTWFNYNETDTNFPSGYLTLVMQNEFNGSMFNNKPTHLLRGNEISVKVYESNGIGAYCGFPSSDSTDSYWGATHGFPLDKEEPSPNHVPFVITTNFSSHRDNWPYSEHGFPVHMFDGRKDMRLDNVTKVVEVFNAIGPGCTNINGCHGNGVCDHCSGNCECFAGYGHEDDLVMVGADLANNCSQKVCPAGRAIADVATGIHKAHAPAECSNAGRCDRVTGDCKCFAPWTGAACDRMRCPNDCSGHGICLSMRAIARLSNILGSSHISGVYYNRDIEYGSLFEDERAHDWEGYDGADAENITAYTTAWDREAMRKCVCDSSWPVGFDKGQRQLGEWFGADCSLRRCPSNDDPYTDQNELFCQGKNQINENYPETGHWGNLCHVDCSNRGTCDYQSGKCQCYEGNFGDDCGRSFMAGKRSSQEFENNGTYGEEVYF